jgi:hypothetical protein
MTFATFSPALSRFLPFGIIAVLRFCTVLTFIAVQDNQFYNEMKVCFCHESCDIIILKIPNSSRLNELGEAGRRLPFSWIADIPQIRKYRSKRCQVHVKNPGRSFYSGFP